MGRHRYSKNEEYWHEIYDLPVFTDEDHPQYDNAWKWAEKLSDSGKLRQTDLIALKALLDICITYNPDG